MTKPFIVFLIVLLIICSCKTSKKAEAAVPLPPGMIMDDAFRKPINDKELFAQTRELVPLDTAYITSDTLHLLTKKIQGCETDNFKLIWNGMLLKSLPPQANIKLFQLVDPSCKEQHSFHLIFNVAPLRYKQDSTRIGQTTILRLGNWKHTIKYDF